MWESYKNCCAIQFFIAPEKTDQIQIKHANTENLISGTKVDYTDVRPQMVLVPQCLKISQSLFCVSSFVLCNLLICFTISL